MKNLLLLILIVISGVTAGFSKHCIDDEFTEWKKVYNRTVEGVIDNDHYVYIRVNICEHSYTDGNTMHTSKYEVRYPDKLSDSTTLFGDLFFVGIKKQIVDKRIYISKDTLYSFFPVTQGEIFSDELKLPFKELTDMYVVLHNIKLKSAVEKDLKWQKATEHIKKALKSDTTKKIIIKHKTAILGIKA